MSTLGERIKASRESKGLLQSELAKLIGVKSANVISNWEKDVSKPDGNKMVRICQVLDISLSYLLDYYGAQKAPSYSDEAMQLAQDYDNQMDTRGRETVRGVADMEVAIYKTILQEQQKKMEAAEESTPELVYFTIPRQLYAMGAGGGQYNDYQSTENQRLIKEPPRGTSYIAPVSGDSMEPTFHDGDLLFVRATVDIRPGQIGVFFMGGQQWVKECGDGELISHNPAYGPEPFTEDVRCQGIVLGVCDNSYFEM